MRKRNFVLWLLTAFFAFDASAAALKYGDIVTMQAAGGKNKGGFAAVGKEPKKQAVGYLNKTKDAGINEQWILVNPSSESQNQEIKIGGEVCLKSFTSGKYLVVTKGDEVSTLAFDIAEVLAIVSRALNDISKPDKKRGNPDESVENMPLIGRSSAMQEIYRSLARLMQTDLTVMITGESGTGKELVARALHDFGKRSKGPFVAINMAAIPRDLIEAELFGHEKGAFTGAAMRSSGRFEQAEGGTLFLDEIGDMPMEAQTRLLRVLQDGEFTMVGGRNSIKSDVRIVAATHRDLAQLIRQGLFREDLYYRLNVMPITMPALRQRSEDIPDLTRFLMKKIARQQLFIQCGAGAEIEDGDFYNKQKCR